MTVFVSSNFQGHRLREGRPTQKILADLLKRAHPGYNLSVDILPVFGIG
jgi:hypothetical protein